MKEIELKSSEKMKVKRDGVEYELRKPKLGEVLALEKKIKELKESNSSGNEELISFLEAAGLPREVVLDLDQEEAEAVLNLINGSKKNG